MAKGADEKQQGKKKPKVEHNKTEAAAPSAFAGGKQGQRGHNPFGKKG